MSTSVRRLRKCTLWLAVVLALFAGAPQGPTAAADDQFIRGDVNQDGRISISDLIFLRRYLSLGEPVPPCLDAADVDDFWHVINFKDYFELLHTFCPLTAPRFIIPEPFPLPGDDLTTADPFDCGSYVIRPGEATDDVLRIGDVIAYAGHEVEIPIYLQNGVEVDAVQLLIEADSPALTIVTGPDSIRPGPAFEEAEDPAQSLYNIMDAEEELGCYYVFALPSATGINHQGTIRPSEEERLLLSIVAYVPDDTPAGTVIQYRFTDGPDNDGLGPYRLKNELSHRGEAVYATLYPRRLIGGKVMVKDTPDTLDYMRADANGDGKVSIADPIFTLSFLYGNGSEPACADAADVNDDGIVNVADAIAGLTYIFDMDGSVSLAAANNLGRCAQDATADGLPACRYDRCGSK